MNRDKNPKSTQKHSTSIAEPSWIARPSTSVQNSICAWKQEQNSLFKHLLIQSP